MLGGGSAGMWLPAGSCQRQGPASARARRESRGLHYNPDCPLHGDPLPRPSRIRLSDLD